jgi:hypothetical protein
VQYEDDKPIEAKPVKPKVKKVKPKKVAPEPEPVKISKKKLQFFISPYTEEIESDSDHTEEFEAEKRTSDDPYERDAQLIDNSSSVKKSGSSFKQEKQFKKYDYMDQNNDLISKVKSHQQQSKNITKVC